MLVGSVGNKDLKVEEQLATWQHGASVAKQQGTRRPWETGQRRCHLNGNPLELILRGDFLIYRAKTPRVSVATPKNERCYITQG